MPKRLISGRYICTVCQMLVWLRRQTINSDCIPLGQSTDSCNCKDILFSSFIQEASHQVLTLCWSPDHVVLCFRVSRVVGMCDCDARWCVWLFRDGIGIPAGPETWEALLCSAPLRLPVCKWKRQPREKWKWRRGGLFGQRLSWYFLGGGWYLRLENCEVMRLGSEKWDFWKRRGRKKTMETAKYQEPFRVSPSSLSLKVIFISMVSHLLLWSCHHYQGKDIAKYREPFRVSPTLQWHLSPSSGPFFARPL